jgi:hypothetical protein
MNKLCDLFIIIAYQHVMIAGWTNRNSDVNCQIIILVHRISIPAYAIEQQ